MELLAYTATFLGRSRLWAFFAIVLHCWEALGSRTPSLHYLTARQHWAVGLLQCTITVLGSNGQLDSFCALPHC